eukprot:scaffold329922_cov17-Prasinocladus_malaysianus.AAC.1
MHRSFIARIILVRFVSCDIISFQVIYSYSVSRGFLHGGCGAACIATEPLGVLKTPLPGGVAARAGGGLPAGLGL